MPHELVTREQAVDVIEDALTTLATPHGRGLATGLCSAFHMAGLITPAEWQTYMQRIPEEHIHA